MDDPKPPPASASEPEDVLVGGLIHELRHPLLGIKAGLQLLALRAGAAIISSEDWLMVTAQVARMEELFNTYQGLFNGRGAAATEFEVEPVVRHAVRLLRYRLGALGARFSHLPGPDGVLAIGTSQALFHALTNLIVNAIDAVNEAGGARRLQVRTLPQRGFVEIRVSDEGAGIAPDHQKLLFTERFTTKPVGHGSGLGLLLARTALAACGGELRLVAGDDPARAPWASTEFAIRVPTKGEPR